MPNTLFEQLIQTLPDAPVERLVVGLSWTVLVTSVAGEQRCGLAATQRAATPHGVPAVADAGHLLGRTARELAELVYSTSLTERAIGMAAINALLPRHKAAWTEINASKVIAHFGAGRQVALVGHFPFVTWLRERVGRLAVLELNPQPGDLPAEAAPEVIPQSDVVAITATTLINGTFEDLLALCRPQALVLVLGPSTPLSPLLFEHGVHILSGAVVENVPAALAAVEQGANFRQLHRAGVRLVTMTAPDLPWPVNIVHAEVERSA